MRNVIVPLSFLICSTPTISQQNGQPDAKNGKAPQEICDAAAPKLHESGTHEVVLVVVVDTNGKAESFKTESPKGLRLEKMKEAAAAVKAMRFKPATKDGQPVKAMVPVEFDCSGKESDSKN